ncbi:hypothetical protein HETIRDRAFT_432189 [Heterobasidion irregulare TC 32-1]|uniref:Uncharacterized protein n=1 Tax=Heterobasidion irregulare (strain TC 32-1) TaxID=747525 RepID=W4KK68_HETIT|nr:uncharacterized protein HETIRDRAFT_432189 [Heterobasidion irregulare TC 32-1]ETW85441.1 hypothetical protein HETIRDRAFT_432189 [Heterobasidion irregulare TC 32-1]
MRMCGTCGTCVCAVGGRSGHGGEYGGLSGDGASTGGSSASASRLCARTHRHTHACGAKRDDEERKEKAGAARRVIELVIVVVIERGALHLARATRGLTIRASSPSFPSSSSSRGSPAGRRARASMVSSRVCTTQPSSDPARGPAPLAPPRDSMARFCARGAGSSSAAAREHGGTLTEGRSPPCANVLVGVGVGVGEGEGERGRFGRARGVRGECGSTSIEIRHASKYWSE